MFKLEEKMIGDKDTYFDDLIKTYRKEEHKEQLVLLQKKLRTDGADKEALLKEIYEHAKKGVDVILGV